MPDMTDAFTMAWIGQGPNRRPVAGGPDATHRAERPAAKVSAVPAPAGDNARILRGLQEGRSQALEELNQLSGPGLLQSARLWLGDSHGAEDLVQDVLMVAWRTSRRCQGPDALLPWLYGILRNQVRKEVLRRVRRRRRETRAAGGSDAVQAEASRTLEVQEAQSELERAIAALPRRWREVIVMRYLRELSVEDTARALGIPEGTVKSRSTRGLAALRARLVGAASGDGADRAGNAGNAGNSEGARP